MVLEIFISMVHFSGPRRW